MNKIILTILIIFLTFSVYSQKQKDEPSWVYLKKAQNLKEKGDYAQAIIQARKSKQVFINEKLDVYYKEQSDIQRDKTDYEIKKLVEVKRNELMKNDDYPQFHEIMGDLYVLTDFLDEAVKEYKKSLEQKKYFEYSQKSVEIRYKLASVYEKNLNFEVADIIYREIADDFFKKKNQATWSRIKEYIKKDSSLIHIFRIFREDGIEYVKAFYKIGRRSAILQRSDDALFYLSISSVIYMSFINDIIKKSEFNFQYSSPIDFLPYLTRKDFAENFYETDNYFGEILFYIGYSNQLKGEYKIAENYFNMAVNFSKINGRSKDIKDRVEYFKRDKNHKIGYEEIID